jgi:hypothetical protein
MGNFEQSDPLNVTQLCHGRYIAVTSPQQPFNHCGSVAGRALWVFGMVKLQTGAAIIVRFQ